MTEKDTAEIGVVVDGWVQYYVNITVDEGGFVIPDEADRVEVDSEWTVTVDQTSDGARIRLLGGE